MPKAVTQHAAVRADVLQLYREIAADNVQAAERLLESIEETFQRIALFPKSGHPYRVPAFKQFHVAQVPRFRSCLIFYKDTPQAVRVLYILNGRRNLPALMARDRRK